ACWSSGGLETQMFTFFAAVGVLAYFGEAWLVSGVAFALCAMTRPEGGLIFAVAVLHRLGANLIVERRLLPRRGELFWGAAFLALYLPYFAWRWRYYGWPFPNTFYVKAGGVPSPQYTREMLRHGLYYVGQWAMQSGAIFAAPLALWGALRR